MKTSWTNDVVSYSLNVQFPSGNKDIFINDGGLYETVAMATLLDEFSRENFPVRICNGDEIKSINELSTTCLSLKCKKIMQIEQFDLLRKSRRLGQLYLAYKGFNPRQIMGQIEQNLNFKTSNESYYIRTGH